MRRFLPLALGAQTMPSSWVPDLPILQLTLRVRWPTGSFLHYGYGGGIVVRCLDAALWMLFGRTRVTSVAETIDEGDGLGSGCPAGMTSHPIGR